jgi:flavin reductase (DIM6/NTAB) family NADH-FMN oxidoreductase RutF
MTFDSQQFRDALGGFATGVTVITSYSLDQKPIGITVNSFSSVSLDPPLILFSLGHKGNHCQEFQQYGKFAVHILGDEQGPLCELFASPKEERFSDVTYDLGENGSPVLAGSIGVLECETHQLVEAGDHLIFICRVTNVQTDPSKKPLLFFKGGFPSIG